MIVQVPDNQVYGSALVSGWTQGGSTETLLMAVVLKAAYDIAPDGAGGQMLVPTEDETRVEIIYQDDGTFRYTSPASNIHVIPPDAFGTVEVDDDANVTPSNFDPSDKGKLFFAFGSSNLLVEVESANHDFEFDLEYEADIALEKARADVVVRGYMPDASTNPVDGSVRVDNVGWLTRNAVLRLRDTSRNLFGFQPRMEASRKIDVDADFVPSEGNLLPPNYSSSFNNFHRSSAGFTFAVAAQLPSGGLVEVHKTADQSDTAYSFTLPGLDLTARYRFHDGTLPDHEHCWRTSEVGPMRPDTLIVEPDDNRATILWRVSWVAAAQPFAAYRRIEITQGDA